MMLAAQMDGWDTIFVVLVAVGAATIFLLLHIVVSHRPRGGKDG